MSKSPCTATVTGLAGDPISLFGRLGPGSVTFAFCVIHCARESSELGFCKLGVKVTHPTLGFGGTGGDIPVYLPGNVPPTIFAFELSAEFVYPIARTGGTGGFAHVLATRLSFPVTLNWAELDPAKVTLLPASVSAEEIVNSTGTTTYCSNFCVLGAITASAVICSTWIDVGVGGTGGGPAVPFTSPGFRMPFLSTCAGS